MKKPDDMTDAEWAAFTKAARDQNINANDHPDDVEPWLNLWLAGLKYARAES